MKVNDLSWSFVSKLTLEDDCGRSFEPKWTTTAHKLWVRVEVPFRILRPLDFATVLDFVTELEIFWAVEFHPLLVLCIVHFQSFSPSILTNMDHQLWGKIVLFILGQLSRYQWRNIYPVNVRDMRFLKPGFYSIKYGFLWLNFSTMSIYYWLIYI